MGGFACCRGSVRGPCGLFRCLDSVPARSLGSRQPTWKGGSDSVPVGMTERPRSSGAAVRAAQGPGSPPAEMCRCLSNSKTQCVCISPSHIYPRALQNHGTTAGLIAVFLLTSKAYQSLNDIARQLARLLQIVPSSATNCSNLNPTQLTETLGEP